MTVVLRAGEARLELDPDDGARWTSLQVHGLELLTAAAGDGVPAPFASGCFAMAPFAGRVRDGVLTFGGTSHALPPDVGPHAMHGTVVRSPWRVVRQDDAAVSLQVRLAAPWPFAGVVRLGLALQPDRLRAVLSLHAEQDMPAWLGVHPWWRRRLERGDDARLDVDEGRQYALADDGVPTGELVAPRPGPWDDAFRGLRQPVRVVWPGALALSTSSDADTWVLFDQRPEAVCVEPQTAPPDAARLGLAELVPAGSQTSLACTFAWELLGSA